MTPEMVLATLKAGFEFGTEALRFAQTEQGKQLVAKSMADRAVWDKFWSDIAAGMKKLFSGEAFK